MITEKKTELFIPREGDVKPAHGQVAWANESRFVEGTFQQPLTAFAVGYRDPDGIEEELEFVAPIVRTAERFEFAKANAKDDFYMESDDIREIGSDFKKVTSSGEKVTSRTYNKGLVTYVDRDQVRGQSNWEEARVGSLKRRLYRNELGRAYNGLSTAAAAVAKNWNANSDPDLDLLELCDAFGDELGLNPNRIYMGRGAYIKRVRVYRALNNAGGYASAAMTPDELADWLGVEAVRVSTRRYQSTIAAKAKIVGDTAIAFMAMSGALPEDPSNIKRFVSPCEGGGDFRVYMKEESAKLISITVEHYSNIVITSTLGLRKLVIEQK